MFRSIAAILWASLSISWIFFDQGIRDWDEEGHVGAAELHFLQPLRGAEYGTALSNTWIGDTGDYPPLGYALFGGWWWLNSDDDAALAHQPSVPEVRAFGLSSMLVAAWACASLLRRNSKRDDPLRPGELIAFVCVLSLPLANGLSRHFMLEGLLTGSVALAILAAVRAAEHPSTIRIILLGLSLGAGMLIKQTFVFYVAIPVLWVLGPAIVRRPIRILSAFGVATLVALPWYAKFWSRQTEYGLSSVQATAENQVLDEFLYYPTVLLWQGLGPIIFLGLGAAIFGWLSSSNTNRRMDRTRNKQMLLGALWLFGGLLVLMLLPKKYPRLVVPLTPAVGLILGAWVAEHKAARWIAGIGGTAMLTWLGVVSFRPVPTPTLVDTVDAGDIQHWIRPPMESDLGLSTASLAIRSYPPGPIWVENPPDIPNTVQTTENWVLHLLPYLRREGMNEDQWPVYVLVDGELCVPSDGSFRPLSGEETPDQAPSARVVWGIRPADVEIPELQSGFQVLHGQTTREP